MGVTREKGFPLAHRNVSLGMQFFPFQAIISLNYSTSVGQLVSSASVPGCSGRMAPGVRERNVARLTFVPRREQHFT